MFIERHVHAQAKIISHIFSFFDDLTLIVRMPDGFFAVDLRTLCEHLGIDWLGEEAPLRARGDGSIYLQELAHEHPERRPMLALRALQAWLDQIDPARLTPWARVKLRLYQERLVPEVWRTFPTIMPAEYGGVDGDGLTGEELAAVFGVPPDVVETCAAQAGILGDPRYGYWASERDGRDGRAPPQRVELRDPGGSNGQRRGAPRGRRSRPTRSRS